MAGLNRTDTVRKGDSPWKIAKRNLQQNQQNVTNADIMKEMQRLAHLNGCKNAEEFNKKFFSTTGKQYTISEQSAPTVNKPKAEAKDSTRVSTQIKVDTTKTNKTQRIDSTKVKTTEKADSTQTKVQLQKTPEQHHADRINKLPNDTARIVEHNKTSYRGKYYGIVDKKSCQLKIYDKMGNVVKTFTVGVGKSKGDGLGSYYTDHHQKTKDAHKAEQYRYTTAGEFTLDEVTKTTDAYTGKDGKPKVMHLKGDNRGYRGGQMALHMLYKPQYAQREAAIKSKGLEDNRMSYGCVNLTEENWNEMHQYLGEGDKLYILPEEKGNKLQLEKQKDGSYKFAQAYHKSDRRDLTKEQASKVNYDVRPEKNPTYIAKQEAAKKQAASKQTAQVKTTIQKQETHWYDPKTWFS